MATDHTAILTQLKTRRNAFDPFNCNKFPIDGVDKNGKHSFEFLMYLYLILSLDADTGFFRLGIENEKKRC